MCLGTIFQINSLSLPNPIVHTCLQDQRGVRDNPLQNRASTGARQPYRAAPPPPGGKKAPHRADNGKKVDHHPLETSTPATTQSTVSLHHLCYC